MTEKKYAICIIYCLMQDSGHIVPSAADKDFAVYYGNTEYRLTDLIGYAQEQ